MPPDKTEVNISMEFYKSRTWDRCVVSVSGLFDTIVLTRNTKDHLTDGLGVVLPAKHDEYSLQKLYIFCL